MFSIKVYYTSKMKRSGFKKVSMITYLGIRGSRWGKYKGVLWTIFSRYVRKRDFVKYGGKCVSCREYLYDWKDGDAGHYIAVGRPCGFGLLFDEQNVNLQCKRCNNPEFTADAAIPYGYELDKRYGAGTKDALYKRYLRDLTKEYSELEYKSEIEKYIALFDKL